MLCADPKPGEDVPRWHSGALPRAQPDSPPVRSSPSDPSVRRLRSVDFGIARLRLTSFSPLVTPLVRRRGDQRPPRIMANGSCPDRSTHARTRARQKARAPSEGAPAAERVPADMHTPRHRDRKGQAPQGKWRKYLAALVVEGSGVSGKSAGRASSLLTFRLRKAGCKSWLQTHCHNLSGAKP